MKKRQAISHSQLGYAYSVTAYVITGQDTCCMMTSHLCAVIGHAQSVSNNVHTRLFTFHTSVELDLTRPVGHVGISR